MQIMDNICEPFALLKAVYQDGTNIKDYIFIEVNNSFEKMVSKDKTTIIDTNLLDVLGNISNYNKNMLDSVAINMEYFEFSQYFDYSKKHYKVKAFTKETNYVSLLFNDITEFMEAQSVLNKHEILFENMKECVIYNKMVFNESNGINETIIVEANRSFIETVEVDKNSIIGKKFSEVMFEIYRSNNRWDTIFYKAAFEKMNYNQEQLYLEKLNRWISVSVYGLEKGYFAFVFLDISDTKKIAIKNEDKFKKIFDESPKGILLCNCNGDITQLNKSVYNMIGEENADKLKNTSIYDGCFLPPECKLKLSKGHKVRTQFRIDYAKLAATGYIANRLNGIKYFDAIFTPLDNREYLVMVEDITDIKQYEGELEKAKLLAEEANNTKSSFIANMSHEIRTPMNGIISTLDLLMNLGVSDEQKDYISLAKLSSKILLDTINSILDLSKIESGKVELEEIQLNLHSVITNVIRQFETMAESKNIKLNCIINNDVPKHVLGDSVRISRILLNIISNAIKFTKEGSVTLNVNTRFISKEYAEIGFSVEDTGIGIPMERMNKLFKSFSQVNSSTTREFGGTGLGLSIAKEIVEMLGGKIWVESIEGKGSKFSFFIKLKRINESIQELNETEYKTECVTETNDFNGFKILVAEDNFVNQKLIAKMLSIKGCSVNVVSNGIEALKLMQKEDFNMILMDAQMPKLDGFETTRRIREIEKTTRAHTIIIAMTALAMRDDKQRCLNCGMDDYLPKPIKIDELYNLLGKYKKAQNDC